MSATTKDISLRFLLVSILSIICSSQLIAQYDTEHYIPPFYARSADVVDLGDHYLFLSTNVTTPFDVTVIESDGSSIATVTISNSSPAEIYLGNLYNATGVVDGNSLNTVLTTEGIIATASLPFFANIRHESGSQGMSLTAKGKWAKGTSFRSGHLYTRLSNPASSIIKAHTISVMATEDNTTVTFSDIKSGVIFNGTPVTGNTSDEITVVLDQYESYIISAHIDEPNATGNDTLVNGTSITSDRPIVVNSGSWCGGSNLTSAGTSRDIGVDQIVPASLLGVEYIVVKRYENNEEETERVIVIADEDNTTVTVNGAASPNATLNTGEFYIVPAAEFDVNDVMYIETSAPAYVYQSTNGKSVADGTPNAQGLNFIPPLGCTGINEVTIPSVDFLGGQPAGIDVIAQVGSAVMVNGAPIAVPSYPVTGNPDWQVYKLSGQTGDLNIQSDDNMNIALVANSGNRGAAGYFSGFTAFEAEIEAFSLSGDSLVTEACEQGMFVLTKPLSAFSDDVTFYLSIDGDAENGVDYDWIPDSLVVAAGELSDTLFINTLLDGLQEFNEQIIITITNEDDCDTISITDTLYIQDYVNMQITDFATAQIICPDFGEGAELFVSVINGAEPYTYEWTPNDLGNTASGIVFPQDNTIYSVTITDICGGSVESIGVEISANCLPTAPNVITANGDNVNDLFIIDGLGAYPGSRLVVLNRWGDVVYENDNYDNSWDASGVTEGVYFYMLEVNADSETTQEVFTEGKTLHGFVHVEK